MDFQVAQIPLHINLQYADDTMIFGWVDIREAIYIKWVLCCFEAWSGPKINFAKSSFICL